MILRRTFPRGSVPRCSVPLQTFQHRRHRRAHDRFGSSVITCPLKSFSKAACRCSRRQDEWARRLAGCSLLLTFKTPELLHFKTEPSIQRPKTAVSVRFCKKRGFGTVTTLNSVYFSCFVDAVTVHHRNVATCSDCSRRHGD